MPDFAILYRTVFVFALLFGMFIAKNIYAQPSGARGTDFMYQVIAKDTLIDLSTRFTDKPSNWSELQKLNQVANPYALSIGRYLRIPFGLIPELSSSARVSHLIGSASVNGKALRLADLVYEGDTIKTTKNSYLTLALEDNSSSTVIADSTMQIQRLRTFKGTGLLDAIFVLEKGSIESAVAPENTGVGRFEIRTPVSITGVRGTQLRVHSGTQGSTTEVLQGKAQQGSGATNDPTIRQGQAAIVDINGQFLGVRNLLPAPIPHPAPANQPSNIISFDPVPGAAAYIVHVSRDPDGTQPLSKHKFTEPKINVTVSNPGTHYMVIRAADADGVMGHDAVIPFDGQAVLQSSNGQPIISGSGNPIRLSLY